MGQNDEDRLKLDYPSFEDAVRAVGKAGPLPGKQSGPVFPEGVQIEEEGTDDHRRWRYRVIVDGGKTWVVEVAQVGAYYQARLPQQDALKPDKPRLYVSPEFALRAAVRYIQRVEARAGG